uniref:Uncharacterized protein n=1 Tax=Octopus bimaculoides TaxID=37653 RepID=A0A0L8IAM7_OCTBM
MDFHLSSSITIPIASWCLIGMLFFGVRLLSATQFNCLAARSLWKRWCSVV